MLASSNHNSTSQPQIFQASNNFGGASSNHSRQQSRADLNLMSPPTSSLKSLVSPRQGSSMPRISTQSRNAADAIQSFTNPALMSSPYSPTQRQSGGREAFASPIASRYTRKQDSTSSQRSISPLRVFGSKKPSSQATSRIGTQSQPRYSRKGGSSSVFKDDRNLPSIREMVMATERLDNTFAMKEYKIADFDGKDTVMQRAPKKASDWNKSKGGNFIDFYAKQKAHVPPPNHYKSVENGLKEKVKTPSLYKTSRQTEFHKIIEKAKKNPLGPATFTPKQAQQKIIGCYQSAARVTMAEQIMAASSTPAANKYNTNNFDYCKHRDRRTIIKEESEKQKEMSIRRWARTDQPNPFSYKVENAEKIVTQRNKSYSFVKGARTTIAEDIIKQEKRQKKPSIGSYKIETAEARLYRPTVRRR